jgi:hypothetical protein
VSSTPPRKGVDIKVELLRESRLAADYEPPDHGGTPRRLSELQDDDRLILTLVRGRYCPKEHQQQLEFATPVELELILEVTRWSGVSIARAGVSLHHPKEHLWQRQEFQSPL